MSADPCAAIWNHADWLTIDAAAAMWCAGDPVCEVARRSAIASAVERGEIDARDSESWGDNPATLVAGGRGWRVQVSRVSLALWADSLPPETRPRASLNTRVRLDDSHLRIIDALAMKAGIDLAVHGSAARLRELSELAGRAIEPDAAERIAKRIRDKRADWGRV